MRFRAGVAALFAALCIGHSGVHAAEAWQEYDKIINGRQTITAFGPTLFGDNVNLASGGLSFSATDVSISGNNALPVAVTRTFSVRSKAGYPDPDRTIDDGHFGDWELDLPNISGVYATATGWVNGNSGKALLRCSVGNTTEAASPNVTVGTSSFRSHIIWHGNRINIPGRGSAAMLVAKATTPKPSVGGPYYWATSDWTALSCLPTIQNSTGEGFLAITADGTKYWFNHMAAASAAHLRQKRIGKTGYDELTRKRYGLYATRVEDRFGNWVTYTYSNAASAPVRVTSIDSSDGRRITLAYASDRVASVTDGAQTWHYEYSGTSLTAAILPDSSRWTIAFSGGMSPKLGYYTGEPGEPWRDCNNPGDVRPNLNPTVGTITHPSGAVGEFTLGVVRFRRDNVPVDCATGDQNTANDDVSWYPNVWDAYALTHKRVTGPGLPTADWNYTYEHEGAGTTTVISPGNYAQYTFGKTFRADEGKLLGTKIGSGPTAILKTEVSTYQLATSGQPYPTPIADSPQARSDDFTEEYPRPQLSHAISQQGVTFKSQVNAFDSFARSLSVTRSSTPGPSKTDTTQYSDHLSKWVLGQVSQTTTFDATANVVTGEPTTTRPPRCRFGPRHSANCSRP